MRHLTETLVVVFVAAVMMGVPCMAQDVEPPFTWEGEGVASVISEGGIEEIEFEFELSVDEQGMIGGKTSNEDGSSKIQHLFYTEKKYYDVPGLFTRNIVIVLMFNEYGGTPMVGVLNGRILGDRFLYGELMVTSYEQGSDTARALGIGDSEATLMEDGDLPYRLKSALEKCVPIGVVKIEGDYKDTTT